MRLIEWLSRREVYAVAGVLLALVKYLIDRYVAARYGVQWLPWHYWVLPHEGSLLQVPDALRPMYLTLLWTSAPFALVGLTLTYLRLRAAGLHGGWVLLFFVPLLNVMLFLSLCLLPSRAQAEGVSASVRGWQRFVPRDERGSWWAGALLPAPIGVAFCLLGVYGFQQYGWGLFVGAPFAVGLLAPVIAGAHAPRTRGESLAVAGTALLMWGAGLLLLALEGALCLVMAAPIAAVLGLLGALVGHTLQARPNRPGAEWLSLLVLLCVPALMGAETRLTQPPLYAVSTAVEIDAPPEVVWRCVVAFPPLPKPTELPFRLGIAYPTEARIEGTGVGACRYCVFSTGAFVEPITVWNAPHLLRFRVTGNPPALVELSPYGHLPAPHAHGYFVAEQGEFRLTPLPNNRTRLVGTTWYRHNLYPAFYWRWWCDALIHRIHGRVLRHIKAQAEAHR
jgi:hypothetical protein